MTTRIRVCIYNNFKWINEVRTIKPNNLMIVDDYLDATKLYSHSNQRKILVLGGLDSQILHGLGEESW